jgi:hypothetical protein
VSRTGLTGGGGGGNGDSVATGVHTASIVGRVSGVEFSDGSLVQLLMVVFYNAKGRCTKQRP